MSETDDAETANEQLRGRLAAAREALLAALTGLTEQDFAAPLGDHAGGDADGGQTVAGLLASLAARERETGAAVRRALGAPPRPGGAARGLAERLAEADPARLVPPQLIHELAGARYETVLLLETLSIGNEDVELSSGASGVTVVTTIAMALRAVAEREEGAAVLIAQAVARRRTD